MLRSDFCSCRARSHPHWYSNLTPPLSDKTEDRYSRLLTILLLLASAITLLLLARPLLTGTVYTKDDLGNFSLPVRAFYQQALHTGDSFLWCSKLFNGMFLYGEGETGMAHPLHWLLYRTLPLTPAFNLEFLISYAATFLGMYLLLRRLELPRNPALLGAFLWTFSGYNLLHGVWPNAVAVLAHIPWLLLAVDTILCTPNRRTLALAQAGLSFLTASQFLLGWPQGVWFSLIAEGCFAAWRRRRGAGALRLGMVGVGLLIGVMLGGIQLLPTREMLHESVRSAPTMAFRLWVSLDPRNLIQWWSPYAVKDRIYGPQRIHEVAIYNGAFCTLALAWLFLRRRSLGQWRSFTIHLVLFAAVFFVFACGSYLGVYRFIAVLPVANLFRAPARYIVFVHLALAVLAAIALLDMTELLARRERLAWRVLWPLAVPLALGVVTTLLFATVGRGQNFQTWLEAEPSSVRHAGVGLGFILAATLIVVGAARGVRGSLYALPLLLVADTFLWGVRYLWHPAPISYARYVAQAPAPTAAVPGDYVYGKNWGNTDILTLKGMRNTFGYAALIPAKALDASDPLVQRLSGARWTTGKDYPNYVAVPDPMPRARLVTQAQVSANPAADIKHINIAQTALTDYPVILGVGKPGTVQITKDRPGDIEVQTSAPTRQLLVLTESYNAGWRITEDGHPLPLLRAYGDFQACVVDTGAHHLVFQFAPKSLRQGAYLSLAGLLAEILCCLAILRGGRQAAPTISRENHPQIVSRP